MSHGKVTAEYKFNAMRRYLTEAEENGLRAAGNAVRNKYRKNVYTKLGKNTGKIKRGARYKLRAKLRKTEFGFSGSAFYGRFFESGKRQQSPDGIMRALVKNNVPEIRQIIAGEMAVLSGDESSVKARVRRKLPDEG